MQYSRFAAWAVYWHGSAGQPPLPRLRVEAAAVPVSRLSGLVLHVCDESAATTVQLVDSFMPLAAPLVSGDCAPPALEVHDGSLRQHSTHFLARLLFPGGQFPSVREATHRPCPRRHRGARNVIPTPGSPPCITRRCATLRSSSVWLHGCDEGPARHLRVGPMLWAVRGRPPRRGDRILGAVLVGGRRLGASQTRTNLVVRPRAASRVDHCRRGSRRCRRGVVPSGCGTSCWSRLQRHPAMLFVRAARVSLRTEGIDHGQEVAGSVE